MCLAAILCVFTGTGLDSASHLATTLGLDTGMGLGTVSHLASILGLGAGTGFGLDAPDWRSLWWMKQPG